MSTLTHAGGRCADACGCEPFAISGASGAVAAAVVRLLDRGWQVHSEPVETAGGLWRMRVQRA